MGGHKQLGIARRCDCVPVGNINVHIKGDFPHTRETVILNRLSLRHGDLVDMREIRNSERRLKASQLFVVNPTEGDPPKIDVKPPRLDSLRGLASRREPEMTVRAQNPEEMPPPASPAPLPIERCIYDDPQLPAPQTVRPMR